MKYFDLKDNSARFEIRIPKTVKNFILSESKRTGLPVNHLLITQILKFAEAKNFNVEKEKKINEKIRDKFLRKNAYLTYCYIENAVDRVHNIMKRAEAFGRDYPYYAIQQIMIAELKDIDANVPKDALMDYPVMLKEWLECSKDILKVKNYCLNLKDKEPNQYTGSHPDAWNKRRNKRY